MSLLVRTWNVFHGRTSPPSRHLYLERMVRLVTADAPDVVALQEVPPWALGRLEGWSGMTCLGAVTKRGLPAPLARVLQRLDPVHVRSGVTGQANALLVSPRFRLREPPRLLAFEPGRGLERRVCQLLRLQAGDLRLALVNVHATAHHTEIARGQLERVGELVAAANPCIVCGDFNLPGGGLDGFSPPLSGLDQILVRGLRFERVPVRWPDERRRAGERLLSDHAPVEAVIAST